MSRIDCWADIPNEDERKRVMEWARNEPLNGYSELDNRVHVSYVRRPNDPEDASRYWAIIHLFEQYPIHNIHWDNSGEEVIRP